MLVILKVLFSIFKNPYACWKQFSSESEKDFFPSIKEIALICWPFAFVDALYSIFAMMIQGQYVVSSTTFNIAHLKFLHPFLLKSSIYIPVVQAITYPLIVIVYYHVSKLLINASASLFDKKIDEDKLHFVAAAPNAASFLLLIPLIGPFLYPFYKLWIFFAALRKVTSFSIFQSIFTILLPLIIIMLFIAFLLLLASIF